MASSFLRFLDHTQRHITLCGTPLDEWSSRRTYLYLTTHNTHKRQTSMLLARFEPVIPARSREDRDRHFSNIHFNITFASTNTSPAWGSYFEVSRSILVHFLPLSREIYGPLNWSSFILSAMVVWKVLGLTMKKKCILSKLFLFFNIISLKTNTSI